MVSRCCRNTWHFSVGPGVAHLGVSLLLQASSRLVLLLLQESPISTTFEVFLLKLFGLLVSVTFLIAYRLYLDPWFILLQLSAFVSNCTALLVLHSFASL